MIDHFFDIKQEKQDRILNAVLKVFAQNGYKRASTDVMVREAAISKGLLFHYFTSKAQLYAFAYQYSVKYMTLELSALTASGETDYFRLKAGIEQVRCKIMKSFPYMPLFLAVAELEGEERTEDVLSTQGDYHAVIAEIEAKADFSGLPGFVDREKLCKLTDYALEGILREAYAKGTPQADEIYRQSAACLDMLRRMVS